MLTTKEKEKLIKQHATHESDTGSPEVQIALLSKEIERLHSHLKKHLKDKHSRRGLLKMVYQRKGLLEYLKKEDTRRYNAVIKKVGLKK